MAVSDKSFLADHVAEGKASLAFISQKISEQAKFLRLFFIVGLLLLVGGFTLANFLVVRQIVAPNNNRIELAIAKKDMDRVAQALQREIRFLSTFTLDWAAWDDTYDFITSANQQYIVSNLVDTTFADNNLNLIAYYDTEGRSVWQRIVDLETMEDLQLAEFPDQGLAADHPLLAHADPLSEVAGIMVLADGETAMLVASRPIVTSEGKGPIVGTLVFARFFNCAAEREIRNLTKIDLQIHSLAELNSPYYDKDLVTELNSGGADVFRVKDQTIQAYSLFKDYLGRPNIVLEAGVDRFISTQTSLLFKYVLISNIVTGIIALAGILLFYNRLTHSLLKIFQLSRVLGQSGAQENEGPVLPEKRWSQLGKDVYRAATVGPSRRLLPVRPAKKSADLWEVSLWLAREVEQRGKAEASLRNISGRLEKLVKDRTVELEDVNRQLQQEIRERRQYEIKLEKYQNRLRAVASEMLAVEERQRRQIAVDLHDRIGQSLSVSRMALDSILELDPNDDVRKQVNLISEILQQTLQDTRTLTFELCPPVLHELGLGAALEWLAEMMKDRYGLQVDVECESLAPYTGSPILTLAFRALRELLMNVVRHADTDSARVRVRHLDEQLHVQVSDHGTGFDAKKLELEDDLVGGFGLFSIQERIKNIGGRIQIHSAVGNGTTITLIIPLSTSEDTSGRRTHAG